MVTHVIQALTVHQILVSITIVLSVEVTIQPVMVKLALVIMVVLQRTVLMDSVLIVQVM